MIIAHFQTQTRASMLQLSLVNSRQCSAMFGSVRLFPIYRIRRDLLFAIIFFVIYDIIISLKFRLAKIIDTQFAG